ncbi:MAG: hypothetical protein EPN91_11855 [Salinibacterium sp.]|nr:MAG: hypothetical protein EPN91_11855 [Salinibacterium sp.]
MRAPEVLDWQDDHPRFTRAVTRDRAFELQVGLMLPLGHVPEWGWLVYALPEMRRVSWGDERGRGGRVAAKQEAERALAKERGRVRRAGVTEVGAGSRAEATGT